MLRRSLSWMKEPVKNMRLPWNHHSLWWNAIEPVPELLLPYANDLSTPLNENVYFGTHNDNNNSYNNDVHCHRAATADCATQQCFSFTSIFFYSAAIIL